MQESEQPARARGAAASGEAPAGEEKVQQPSGPGPFLVIPAVDVLGGEAVRLEQGAYDRVRLRAGTGARLESGHDGLVIRTPWTNVQVEPALAGAATALVDGRTTCVDELDGPPDAVTELVRTLLVRGVLVPAT